MQEVWRCGLDWNDTLPEELTVKMKSWFAELQVLSKIRVPGNLQLKEEVTSTYHFTCVRGHI